MSEKIFFIAKRINIFPTRIKAFSNKSNDNLMYFGGICGIISTQSIFENATSFLYANDVIASEVLSELSNKSIEID